MGLRCATMVALACFKRVTPLHAARLDHGADLIQK